MPDEILIITGGRRNNKPFSMKEMSGCYEAGIYEIDFKKKSILRSYLERSPNPEIYADGYSFSYRGGSILGNTLYSCTHSEVIEFDIASFEVKTRFSSRLFNDLHFAGVVNEKIFVAISGIDHVGEIISHDKIDLYPVVENGNHHLPKDNKDYRVISTKPHQSHPNHVFRLNGDLWATRFWQKDAICLNDLTKRIGIGVARPHDGLVREGRLYFTTVNGLILAYDVLTLEMISMYDVSSLYESFSPGWCRGLEVIDEFAYVGFSTLRWTYSLENLNYFAKNLISLGRELKRNLPSRIIKYDLRQGRIADEMVFKGHDIGLVFSILKP